MKKIFTVITVLILILFVSGCGKEVFSEEIFITSQKSPDGEYTVSLYQIGSPAWSFGSVGAKLILRDRNKKEIDEVDFSLLNDGGSVWEGNIEKVTWLENEVRIIMNESDTTQTYTYILKYK